MVKFEEINEKDFCSDHGCSSTDEYNRKRFEEWVSIMENAFGHNEGMDNPELEEVESKEVEYAKTLVKRSTKVLT